MQLDLSSDDGENYLFERVVAHLQFRFQYTADDAVQLVKRYYANFTNPDFCEKFNIPVQNVNFFCHMEAIAMADRIHYYEGLLHTPNERAFVEWQKNCGLKY